jgi:hypothetical protein
MLVRRMAAAWHGLPGQAPLLRGSSRSSQFPVLLEAKRLQIYACQHPFLHQPQNDYSFQFAERAVRQGFVRKVFGLLSLQLLVTAGVTCAFVMSPALSTYTYTQQVGSAGRLRC